MTLSFQGHLKPAFVAGFDVQAKAWTYFRSNDLFQKQQQRQRATAKAKYEGPSLRSG
jgi:hypothetical protein